MKTDSGVYYWMSPDSILALGLSSDIQTGLMAVPYIMDDVSGYLIDEGRVKLLETVGYTMDFMAPTSKDNIYYPGLKRTSSVAASGVNISAAIGDLDQLTVSPPPAIPETAVPARVVSPIVTEAIPAPITPAPTYQVAWISDDQLNSLSLPHSVAYMAKRVKWVNNGVLGYLLDKETIDCVRHNSNRITISSEPVMSINAVTISA